MFPQLTSGLVAYLNKRICSCSNVESVPIGLVEASTLNRAMLFEVAFARGQQISNGGTVPDWDNCLEVATSRQRRHFDARLPGSLQEADITVAEWVGHNLAHMLNQIQASNSDCALIHSPPIRGYQWIASSEGDFSIGTKLIEVKCTNKNFGAADFRQVVMYWLLSYAATVENDASEWSSCMLLNPRLNHILEFTFDEIIGYIAAGRSKVELVKMFSFVVGEYGLREMGDFDL